MLTSRARWRWLPAYRVSLKFHATNATCTTPTLTTVKLPMVREADFTGAGTTPVTVGKVEAAMLVHIVYQ